MPVRPQASSKAQPQFVEPMYALTVRKLPEGNDWLYEIKLDGYRCLARRDSAGVTLWSRRGNLFTHQFREIADACKHFPPDTLVDGEIVALDHSGRTSFNLLQHHRSMAEAIRFYVFDLLFYRGKSLMTAPLSMKKEVLGILMKPFKRPDSVVALSETIHIAASELMRVIREFGLEGVVAKRGGSVYEPGRRSGAWVKYKVNKGQEFVIGGYTPGNPFDGVIVGYYESDKLLFASKVRNGFVPYSRRELMKRTQPLVTRTCPFANLPEKKRTLWALTSEEMKNCVWLRPELVAQVEFTEWTPDGHLRHANFAGLRHDKEPRRIVREDKPVLLLP
jgi:DNA ligase D-like protein (predicted ligase)